MTITAHERTRRYPPIKFVMCIISNLDAIIDLTAVCSTVAKKSGVR